MKRISLSILFLSSGLFRANAQQVIIDTSTKRLPPVDKFYIGGGLDGLIFSTATIERPYFNGFGILRFTGFFHIGITFNYNPSRNIGLYTGIDLKNVGFIDEIDGTVYKRRTYNAGIPVGVKVGNMARGGMYGLFGAGVDFPLHYKEKQFTIRDQKEKFTEWFSGRTPQIMPYVFAGVKVKKSITLKAQYYLLNYLETDFVQNNTRPYEGYDVHLILLSVGYSTQIHKKPTRHRINRIDHS